jgi:hypothetical protein
MNDTKNSDNWINTIPSKHINKTKRRIEPPIKPNQNTNRFEALETLNDDESDDSDNTKPAASTSNHYYKPSINQIQNEKGVTFSIETSSQTTAISTNDHTKSTTTTSKGILRQPNVITNNQNLNTPINSSLSRALEKDTNNNDIEMEINDDEIPTKSAPVQRH